jgi:hypothetical protein
MAPEMARHIARWGTPSSFSKWENEVDGVRTYLKQRPQYALKNLQREFGLSDETLQEYIDLANGHVG